MSRDRCISRIVVRLSRFLRSSLVTITIAILCVAHVSSLRGQESVRTAAQQLEIASFRNPIAFFHIGPLEEVLLGSVGAGYTDNADLTPTNKISDFSLTQALSLNSTWVISHFNQLQLNFGGELTENFYSNGSNQTTFAVSPGSLLQFQFALSDWQVRLYDSIQNVQNPTSDPAATNVANLNNFTNTAGVEIKRDLSLAVLSLSADYTYNNQSGSTTTGASNPSFTGTRETLRVGSSLQFNWNQTLFYGINTTATRSSGAGGPNVDSLNVGPLIRGKLTPWTDIDFSGGLSLYDTSAPQIEPTTYYFAASIRHQLNPNLQLIFGALHDLAFTNSTFLVEETVIRAGAQVNLTRFITLSATPSIYLGNDKTAPPPGRFTLFGVEAGLVWKPHVRWSTGLTYDFYRREADLVANTYIQNSLTFQVSYAF
jgi:hypothetical protein